MSAEIGGDFLEAHRLATECSGTVHVGVIVHLTEGLQLHAKTLAVVQHCMMVAGDSPGTRIQVIAFSKFDLLGSTAELCEAVSTAKRPAPSAGLFPVFQNPD